VEAPHQEHLHTHLPPDAALRVKALESLLVEKGLVDARTVDRWIELFRDAVARRWRRWGCPGWRPPT
jgi:nitrile hydratase